MSAQAVPSGEKKKMLKIKIECYDGTIVTVDQDVAFKSNLIKDMFANLGRDELEEADVAHALPVGQIDGKTLRKIMEWCTINRSKDCKPKGPDECPRILLTKEEEKYLDIDSDELLALLLAANYMDIQGIIDIVTQKIANMANGRTVEQIREVYAIENNFTPQEEEAIRLKYEWLEM